MSLTLSGGSITGTKVGIWAAGVLHAFWFSAGQPLVQPRATGTQTTTYITTADMVYRHDAAATFVSDFSWPYTIEPNRPTAETITRTSSNAAIVSPNATDLAKWDYQSAGSATLTLASATRTVTANVTAGAVTVADSYTDTFFSLAAGSFRKAVCDAVDSRIAGVGAPYNTLLFSTWNITWRDPNPGVFVRDPTMWAHTMDTTAYALGALGAIAISPRHILMCEHFQNQVGQVLFFCTMDGTVISRTMISRYPLTLISPHLPDFAVGLLDSDLPSGITFARVLPDNWRTKMSNPNAEPYPEELRLPVVCMDYNGALSVRDLMALDTPLVQYAKPVNAQRAHFWQALGGGMSGSAECLYLDSTHHLIVLGNATYATDGWCSSAVAFKSEINAVMSILGGGYQLTDEDLSGFPSY